MDKKIYLDVKNVGKKYSDPEQREKIVLQDISFSLIQGQFVCLLGVSGVGKSTLLNMISGLESPTSGEISFHEEHNVGYVFQQPALLPWKNVLDNVTLPLILNKTKKEERHKIGLDMLKSVGLENVAFSKPSTLSGGMKTRVAVARAMVQKPSLLLLDEPFAALDPLLRETFAINLMKYCHHRNVTSLMVTHSVIEACLISHRVIVIDKGKILEDIEIPLEWPRSREILSDPIFLECVGRINHLMMKTSAANLMPKPVYNKEHMRFLDPGEMSEDKNG